MDNSYEGKTIILDTNILMATKKTSSLKEQFGSADCICVTLGTAQELDRLKSAEGKKGFEARSGLRIIRENDWIKVIDTENDLRPSIDAQKVDGDIILHAKNNDCVVVTNDLSMATIAEANKVEVMNFIEPKDSFRKGFRIFDFRSDNLKDMNYYEYLNEKLKIDSDFLKINEYAVIKEHGVVKHIYRKTETGFEPVTYSKNTKFCSGRLGSFEPKPNDIAQILAFDMLGQHDISLLTGPAGSGKSLLMLAKQFEMLEKEEIQKITIFVNPEKARGAKTLGFYKGDRNLKLMQESIGGILASKLGSMEELIQYIEEDKIEVIPISDIRGYEVPAYSSLYITEAQNLTVDLMQLAIQRAGEGTKVFIEGDPTTQLDSWMYEGDNNGMLKLIETFSGTELLGNIELQKIYRSRIADVAESMTK